jgi:hypothetical protein
MEAKADAFLNASSRSLTDVQSILATATDDECAYLLQATADGYNAIAHAAFFGKHSIVSTLLQAGADSNISGTVSFLIEHLGNDY